MGAEEHRAEPGDPAGLAGRLFRDMTGALDLLTVYLGERLGLYQALHARQAGFRDLDVLPVDAGMLRSTG
jgi:hypothetical protein